MSKVARLFAAGILGGKQKYSKRLTSLFGSSLIALWPMTETSGTAAADISGNSRNGSFSGVTLANMPCPSSVGGAAPLWDGTNIDLMNMYSAGLASTFNTNEGSMFIWAKAQAAGVWTDATERFLMNLDVDNSTYARISKSGTNNTIAANFRAGGANHAVNIATAGTLNWFLVGLTWSQTTDEVKVWYNGAQSGSTVTPVASWVGALGNTRCLIGDRLTTGTANKWSGWACYAGLLNRPFTLPEFQNLYNWGA